MSALERIVRPFQSPELNPNTRIVTSRRRSIAYGQLKFGAAGKMPTPVANVAGFNTKKETYTELSYKSEDVKVKQVDNPDNFVDVKRKTEMVLGKSSTTGSPQTSSSTSTASGSQPDFNSGDYGGGSEAFQPTSSSGTPESTDVTFILKVDRENTEPA